MNNNNKEKNSQKGNFSASPEEKPFVKNYNELPQNNVGSFSNDGSKNDGGNILNDFHHEELQKNDFQKQKYRPGSQTNRGNNLKSNNQNLNRNNKINQAKQKIVKEGAKAAADAAVGPVGGMAVEELSKTKLGQKALNETTKKLNNPFKKPSLFSFLKKNKEEEEISGEGNFSADLAKKIITFFTAGIISINGCLTIIIIASVVCLIVTPLFYINEIIGNVSSKLTTFGEKMGNLLTFRGWCTDEECEEKEKNDFYEKIDKVYEKYKGNPYYVTLNTNLITATLTYADPFSTTAGTDDEASSIYDLLPSNYVDFKKSQKKVDLLATKMVSFCCYEDGAEFKASNGKHMCQGSDHKNYDDINYYCPEDIIDPKTGEILVDYSERYKLDIERYREYLEDDFMLQFYYENKQNDDTQDKINRAVEEIFLRVSFYEEMDFASSSSSYFSGNNIKVVVEDCLNGMVIDEVSLYEYIQGVLYVEGFATGRPEEFLKAMAVVAKNYLFALNKATPDNIPSVLRIRSCQMNQIFCSVTEGCHSWQESTAQNCSAYSSNQTACDTIASGPDENGNYYHEPLATDSATYQKIKNAVDETLSYFIIKDGQFVFTQYRSQCSGTCDSSNNIMDQYEAYKMINAGSSYKDVLNYFYDGDLTEIVLFHGYPLDEVFNNITSPFGWRVHPTYNSCKMHTGVDIGANADANIYAIDSGTIIYNNYNNGYGYYTIIGHGEVDENGNYEYYSAYAHQIRLSTHISVGSKVDAGQLIGNVGSTGTSTGNHLHFEIYRIVNGVKQYENPLSYFENINLIGKLVADYDSQSSCENRN